MTTNLWINYIMKDVENFLGVFSVDNIQSPVYFPAYLVVNFSPSHSPGSHFVSIIFHKKGRCMYFDPLDLKFIPRPIQLYMNENAKNIHKISYPIQNPLSGYCGFYCVMIILLHVNKIPIVEGITAFPRTSLENDDKCISMLAKLFKIFYLEQHNS